MVKTYTSYSLVLDPNDKAEYQRWFKKNSKQASYMQERLRETFMLVLNEVKKERQAEKGVQAVKNAVGDSGSERPSGPEQKDMGSSPLKEDSLGSQEDSHEKNAEGGIGRHDKPLDMFHVMNEVNDAAT